MGARRLLILLAAYLAFDLADPTLPGAFSFEIRDSEIEEVVHVQRRSQDKAATAVRPAPPERRVEPRDDSLSRQPLAVIEPPPRDVSPPYPAPRYYYPYPYYGPYYAPGYAVPGWGVSVCAGRAFHHGFGSFCI